MRMVNIFELASSQSLYSLGSTHGQFNLLVWVADVPSQLQFLHEFIARSLPPIQVEAVSNLHACWLPGRKPSSCKQGGNL